MTRLTKTLAFAALAASMVGCAHDASQLLTLRHASQSGRHEIPPQSKLRVKLVDGTDIDGVYLSRNRGALKLTSLNDPVVDRPRLQIRTQEIVKIRYRANRFRQGVRRGFRNGALLGAVSLGGALFSVAQSWSGTSARIITVSICAGVVFGAPIGGGIGAAYGALRHARYKPPIDVLIDDDAWQIEPLR